MNRFLSLIVLTILPLSVVGQNIAIGNITVTESDAGTVNMDFPITVNPVSAAAITLSYATTAGTATAGSDFTAVTGGSITIPANAASAVARVLVNGDLTVEPNESLTLTISGASGGVIVTNQALGQITDNDSSVLSIASVSQAEGNAGTAPMPFVARLSNPVQGQVRVNVSSGDNSATGGSDYTAIVGTTLTFAPLSVQQPLPVTINGDTILEADETFNLAFSALQNPVGISAITLGAAAIVGTIQNDDSASLSISDVTSTEGSALNSNFVFNVSLAAPSGVPLSVNFATADGTAIAPQDYLSSSGVLSFAPGETQKQIPITVVADILPEANETFEVRVSNPSVNLGLPPRAAVGTIVDDDVFRKLPSLGTFSMLFLASMLMLIGIARK
jgi:large repetitive protein